MVRSSQPSPAEAASTTCIFCQIIARKLPAFVLTEDDDYMVWLALESHPLIVPKKHIANIFELPDQLTSSVMRITKRISIATKAALGADGITITQTNGAAAGQSVFHYHVHVYPRWYDDRRLATDHASTTNTLAAIRAALYRQV